MKLLDPKLDIVFKLLLQRELVLLRSMIETVVSLPAPIEDLVVLNPELPKDLASDKGNRFGCPGEPRQQSQV